jgi:hypothetical protein
MGIGYFSRIKLSAGGVDNPPPFRAKVEEK